MSEADGGQHLRQAGSHRTSSEVLNHSATVKVYYEQSQLKLDTSPHRQLVEPSQDWSDVV